MKVMVFDVPAESGGALSILNQYYDAARADKENEWIFIVSKPALEPLDNVKVLNFPWVKKSWLHRMWFDNVYARGLVKKYKPDKIISLQNTMIKQKICYQELYVHQALPFSEKRFSLKENKKLWVYQNIISKMIFYSIKNCDCITVQTKWMKDAICKKTGVGENKVRVVTPKAIIPENLKYKAGEEVIFFYPAAAQVYKNHEVIYKAVKELKMSGCDNFKVYLTINKPGTFSEKYKEIDNLIEFFGYMEKSKVYELYQKSILLFPSYIETFGLPLLEARTVGCPVIASDCAFSREIIDGYDNGNFFDPFNSLQLADQMKKYV